MTAGQELPHLLSPVEIGPLSLRNRVVSTSHQTGLVEDHLPTADLLAYHEARARGGVGAIFLEATAVHESGLLTAHTIGGFRPEIVSAYRQLGERLREHGARLLVQLFHGGREQISSSPRAPAVAPSAVPSLRFKSEPRALTVKEIQELIRGYAQAAAHAAEGGVDGVEVSMSHGYLPAQFLSPLSNRRRDGYDGSPAARLRFPIEVLQAVRAAAGGRMAVGVRLSADELTPGGLDTAAAGEIAARLHEEGLVDFISLVLGNSAHPAASTWIAPPPPVGADAIAGPAAAIRAAVPQATLLATTRVVDLAGAERLIAGGTADLVGMTRALIADPELVAKTVAGRVEEVIECVGCNQACIGHYHAGVPIGCAVNARTGRERALAPARPRDHPLAPAWPRDHPLAPARPRERTIAPTRRRTSGRSVLVIGGGPAGAAAALEAADRGDDVTLVEREGELGGQLRLAGMAPGHVELWERYHRSTAARLRAAAVAVQLGVDADAKLAQQYEMVVLATGARPYEPAEALTGAIQAWEAIREPQLAAIREPHLGAIGKSQPAMFSALVADWGGGWDGLDAAERLAGAGIEVTLACAAPVPGETLHQYQRNLYLARLDELGVAILHHHELAVPDGEPILRHVFSGRSRPLPPAATLVLAQGRVPVDELWPELESHPGAVRAGDVLGPRTLEEAVLEGTLALAG